MIDHDDPDLIVGTVSAIPHGQPTPDGWTPMDGTVITDPDPALVHWCRDWEPWNLPDGSIRIPNLVDPQRRWIMRTTPANENHTDFPDGPQPQHPVPPSFSLPDLLTQDS
ncbi:MAG: hypothetical protein KDB40_11040 [Acidimicrobiales bacterium]|nr:hypothetical protein [Acidimicrobiales bacterium]MCB9393814.1 hypothetical protein [Acidimicrobiaceae bacterium]